MKIPTPIPNGQSYFAPDRLQRWIDRTLGKGAAKIDAATALGLSKSTMCGLLSGSHAPSLELYVRVCAEARQPVDSFLNHLDAAPRRPLALDKPGRRGKIREPKTRRRA